MVTFENLLNVRPVLETLAAERMPSRTSLKLARIARKVFDALEDFEQTRKDLIAAYAEHDEQGQPRSDENGIVWKEDGREAFEREVKEALKLEVDGLDYTPILIKHWPKQRELEPREALALFEANILAE